MRRVISIVPSRNQAESSFRCLTPHYPSVTHGADMLRFGWLCWEGTHEMSSGTKACGARKQLDALFYADNMPGHAHANLRVRSQ